MIGNTRRNTLLASIGALVFFAVLTAACGEDPVAPPPPAPTLSSVAPAQGPLAGGTAITLTGTNFRPGATVSVGANAATAVVVVNTTTITGVTPAGPAGPTVVSVTTTGGTASLPAAFTYIPPAPTLTSVAPTEGPVAGGTVITLTGTNFTAGATVTVGGNPATAVVVNSSTSITGTTPAGPAGPADVSVTTAGGTASLPAAFTYIPAPTLTSVAPTQGPVAGGTAITLTGTNFIAGATVTVGANPATAVVVVNATTITCTTPAGPVGPADVSVTTAGGTASLPAAFTYNPPPTITNVGPDAVGATSGGMHHTITGTGFVANAAGPNTVTIGGNPATNCVTVDDFTITCDSPPAAAAGATTLEVTNANGTASSPFTYFDPIWGAEGGGCTPSVADCTFFVIDAATGIHYPIGPIGTGVTGMFYFGGILYGTTSGGTAAPRELITIDPMTGVGTSIGPTNDAGAVNYPFRDVTFDINAGWPYGTTPCELRRFSASGLVDPAISAVPNCAPGGGIAQDAAGATIYFMMGSSDPLYTVNTSTGVFTPGPIVSGSILTGTCALGSSCFGGAAFHNGTLYAVEMDAGGGNRQLHSVNTTTGVLTPVGQLLPSWTSAIVSATR